jgi:hypothetical protein
MIGDPGSLVPYAAILRELYREMPAIGGRGRRTVTAAVVSRDDDDDAADDQLRGFELEDALVAFRIG